MRYQDPLEEFGNREIPYLPSEIAGFETFVSKEMGKLKSLSNYTQKATVEEDERTILLPKKIIFDQIPKGIWNDPFYFFEGQFKREISHLDMINEIILEFQPHIIEPVLEKRTNFSEDKIIIKSKKCGIKKVGIKKIGEQQFHSGFDYMIMEFALSDITPEEYLNKKKRIRKLKTILQQQNYQILLQC